MEKEAGKSFYLGIDVGSTASKCVVIGEDAKICGKGMSKSGTGTDGPVIALDLALANAGLKEPNEPPLKGADLTGEDGNYALAALRDIAVSCATGYGRKRQAWTDYELSELSCHAMGATMLFPGTRTVIDIGGQDVKVLRLDDEGTLCEFVMNDKCAAGTGRFLDAMANIFGCEVSDLSAYDEKADSVASISSTCAVFAESEVISKLSQGEDVPAIAAGIHMSVVDRVAGLAKRVGVVDPVAMTGGVARNDSIRKRLSERLGHEVAVSPLSQFAGALGAAAYAKKKRQRLG